MELLRWVTIHPILVHFTIGALPIMVLAYALARIYRSEQWTFVGDVTLGVTALAALATAGFGLVSFALVDWPGGLEFWKWLHLALGIAVTVLLVVLAVYRLRVRRRWPTSGSFTLGAVVAVALLAGGAGWVGGEVLVYRGGIAVEAAGGGVLAQPVFVVEAGAPDDLHDAMARLRARWAAIQTTIAEMVIESPSAAQFEQIAREARAMHGTAAWMEDFAGPLPSPAVAAGAHDSGAPPAPRYSEHGDPSSESGGHESFAQKVAKMSPDLTRKIDHVVSSADAHDLVGTVRAAGELTAKCAKCHGELRWNSDQ